MRDGEADLDEGFVAAEAFTVGVRVKPLALDPDGENRLMFKHGQFTLDPPFGRAERRALNKGPT